jgi:uncharacterized protein YjiS (DUF1127 family)
MPMFAATLSSALLSVVAVVRRQAEVLRNWRQSREDYRMLCEMDEKTLADLGLTRSDVRDATAAGYFGDPTLIIATRAAERHGIRRPMSFTGPSIIPDVTAALPEVASCN